MDAKQHIIANLLEVDPSDSAAVQAALADFLDTNIRPAQRQTELFEDFLGLGATLGDTPNVLVSQSGTATTTAAVSAAAGDVAGSRGWLLGSVDNVDAEIDEVALGKLPWIKVSAIPSGTRARCEIGMVIPTALTARQYFFGFTDDEVEGTATNGPLNIQTARTIVDVADNAVGFVFSSLATAPTVWKYGNSNAGTQSTNGTDTSLTGVVDAYTTLAVEVDNAGNAYLYGAVGPGRGKTPPLLATVPLAVATTALLIPMFTAAATTTTAVEWEIDYLAGSIG